MASTTSVVFGQKLEWDVERFWRGVKEGTKANDGRKIWLRIWTNVRLAFLYNLMQLTDEKSPLECGLAGFS